MLFTLKDVAQFCYDHQKTREKSGELVKRSFEEWCRIIVGACNLNKLHIVESNDGRLTGICIASIKPATKLVYVHEIICIENAFKLFIKTAFARYPNYRITGLRNKQTKTYTKDNLWAEAHHHQ